LRDSQSIILISKAASAASSNWGKIKWVKQQWILKTKSSSNWPASSRSGGLKVQQQQKIQQAWLWGVQEKHGRWWVVAGM
jgi:hypothetical protein